MSNNKALLKAAFNKHGQRPQSTGLKPSGAKRIDGESQSTGGSKCETVATGQCADHWLLCHPLYMKKGLLPIVRELREVNGTVSSLDTRSDEALAESIIRGIGLWEHPQPKGFWARMAFVVRFNQRLMRIRTILQIVRNDRSLAKHLKVTFPSVS